MQSLRCAAPRLRAGAPCPIRRVSYSRTPILPVRASAQNNGEVYQGRFGPWTVEPSDVAEVWGYRVGISAMALATVSTASLAFLPNATPGYEALAASSNAICLMGAGGLGVSLVLIHIYLAPLKRMLQLFWLLGLCGGIYLMASQDQPAALYIASHPEGVWLVGPLFAALTGVAFKEGLCYGKWEAAGLFGCVPLVMLGHLTQIVSADGEKGLLASMVILLSVFAARKYTQPIKDDIGDKSVFEFLKLSPEEQEKQLQQ